MTVVSDNGSFVLCSFFDEITGAPRTVQFREFAVFAVPQQPPTGGFSTSMVTLPLGQNLGQAIGFETQYPRQCVVAGAGVVPFTFSPSGLGPGNVSIALVANGISAAPAVTGATSLDELAYFNTAGMLNTLSFQGDGSNCYFQWSPGYQLPTPTTFIGALNGTALTIGIGGLTLGAVTPPLSAFTLAASRSGAPAPYFLSLDQRR
jgi:hypothetical protein